MKILLVYPEFGGVPGIHHGLTSLSAILKARGHDVRLSIWDDPKNEHIGRYDFVADVIAFSLMETHIQAFKYLYSTSLRFIDAKLIVGGPAAKEFKDWEYGIDHIVIGEADEMIVDIIEHPIARVHNMGSYPKLDPLPPEDLELFPLDTILEARDGQLELMLGRGCAYNCSYCINGGITYKRGYIRMKPLKTIQAEILSIFERTDLKSIYFIDDDFLIYQLLFPEEFQAFLDWYEREIHIPFLINCNPDTAVRSGMFQKLFWFGCTGIRIGIEAVSHLRHEVLNRKIRDDVIKACVLKAHDAHLTVGSYNMIGLPTETPTDVMHLLKFNAELEIDFIKLMFFYPFANTPIFDDYKNLIDMEKRDRLTDYESDSCLKFDPWYLEFLRNVHDNLPEWLEVFNNYDTFYTRLSKSVVRRESC